MTKYTINKVFEETFQNPIWKIEVDAVNEYLAIETRDPQTTIPTFHIYSFNGKSILSAYTVIEKEWSLASIQNDFLILKKVGSSTPIQAGIQIFNFKTQSIVASFSEYALKEVLADNLIALHRSIPSGLFFFIEISSGKVSSKIKNEIPFHNSEVEYPTIYKGILPSFMQEIKYEEHIWLQSCKDYFIWTFLHKVEEHYEQHLILSTKNQICKQLIVLNSLNKLILQPYFKVKDHIFFLSDTKQEIVTYLV